MSNIKDSEIKSVIERGSGDFKETRRPYVDVIEHLGVKYSLAIVNLTEERRNSLMNEGTFSELENIQQFAVVSANKVDIDESTSQNADFIESYAGTVI